MHDWHDFFDRVPDNLEKGIYRIFERQWHSEIMHWFGREDVASDRKEAFIKALVNFDDDCGDFYRYRAYFLATEAIAHFPDSSLADALVEQLLKWSYSYFQRKPDWKIFPQPLKNCARAALETTDKNSVIAAFEKLVHTTQSQHVLRVAAEKLGRIDPGNQSALAALVLLIQVTAHEYTRQKTICSLGAIGEGNEVAIATLFKLIQSNQNERIVWEAAKALGEIASGNSEAIAALSQLIQTTQNSSIIWLAIESLGKISPKGNETAIDALIGFMQTQQSSCNYDRAAEFLAKICAENETATAKRNQAIVILAEIVDTNPDVAIRYLSATSLVKIDRGNEKAIAFLSQILETSQDNFIRWKAADTLTQIDPNHQLSIDVLCELVAQGFDDREYFPSNPYVDSLMRIDASGKLAIDSLIQAIVKNVGNRYIIGYAAADLANIDAGNKRAIDAIIELIASTQDESSLDVAVCTLGQIAAGNEAAISTLIQLISSTQEPEILKTAAESLGKIDPGNETAIATLVKLIQNSEDANISWRAADKLAQISAGNEKAIATLIHLIQNLQNQGDLQSFLPLVGPVCDYSLYLDRIVDSFCKNLRDRQLPQVVTTLKNYLNPQSYKECYKRYDACYQIIWNCAQKLPYSDFYKAWHS